MSKYRKRQIGLIISVVLAAFAFLFYNHDPTSGQEDFLGTSNARQQVEPPQYSDSVLAIDILRELDVKGRAPKTGYIRAQFGNGWESRQGCDTRNIILNRDLQNIITDTQCQVVSGSLNDPYTGRTIQFKRGSSTSAEIQIDHVVALSDAWQKGASEWSPVKRSEFANDPMNLLAVSGSENQTKSDSDAASWLPPYKPFRCQYVGRQISVKYHYDLWVTRAEKDAMERVLSTCPKQAIIVKNQLQNEQ